MVEIDRSTGTRVEKAPERNESYQNIDVKREKNVDKNTLEREISRLGDLRDTYFRLHMSFGFFI